MKVEARFEARLEETQRTQVRYGFRNDTWLVKHHGERKANKIMQRKKDLGLTLIFEQSLVGSWSNNWYSVMTLQVSVSCYPQNPWHSVIITSDPMTEPAPTSNLQLSFRRGPSNQEPTDLGPFRIQNSLEKMNPSTSSWWSSIWMTFGSSKE